MSNMSKVCPQMTSQIQAIRAIHKYSNNTPKLNWNNNQMSSSKRHYACHPWQHANICFQDESTTRNAMWFVIELPTSFEIFRRARSIFSEHQHSLGFFFSYNPVDSKVNLLFRAKQNNGK